MIGVKFDIFAGSLHRLASLYVTGVPGFHHITHRATPATAVFPKSYVSLGSTSTSCLSWGIDPTAYPPDVLLTYPSVEMSFVYQVLSSSHAISLCDWAVLWVASKAVGARESVRLATIRGGGVWSKTSMQGAFWLCLRPLSGLKPSMLSLFLKV